MRASFRDPLFDRRGGDGGGGRGGAGDGEVMLLPGEETRRCLCQCRYPLSSRW